jgi:hypothetical protein
MAAAIQRGNLEGQRERVLWREFGRYAQRRFANDAQDWRTQSTCFANMTMQAHKAVRTDALSIAFCLCRTGCLAMHRKFGRVLLFGADGRCSATIRIGMP